MNTLSTTSLLARSLSWALLYSLWQGLLLYAAVFITLRALPNVHARLKYYLSLSAFAALFIWFADTWVSQYQKLKGTTVYITSTSADNAPPTTYSVKALPAASQEGLMHHYLLQLEHYFPFIMLIYFVGLAFMLFRLLVNYTQVNMLKQAGTLQPEPYWNDVLQKWKAQMGISRPVRLLLSTRINVPMMIGAIKPVILLPVATINHLTTEQVEAILMHELAHIRRQDYLLNILQSIGETVLFFNPFVWLISAAIRHERELCCDDMVLESATSPLSYARALAILEDNRMNDNDLALAATGNKSQLFHRIKRIMEMKKRNLNYGQVTIILLAIVAVAFIAVMCTSTPLLAQNAKKDKGDTTTHTKSVYKYKSVIIDDKGKKTEKEVTSDKPIDNDEASEPPIPPVPPVPPAAAIPPAPPDEPDDADMGTGFSFNFSTDSSDMKRLAYDLSNMTRDITAEIGTSMEKVQKELAAIDRNSINKEIKESMEEVDREVNDPKMRKEIKEEIRKGMEEGKRAMEHAKKQMENAKVQMEDAKRQMKEQAYYGNNHGKVSYDSHSFENMLDEMEDDGLINRSRDFKIRKEGDELYINGELQPNRVYKKYHKYLKDKTVLIKGRKGNLTININD